MKIFVPQPIHGGFLSQMLFLFPDVEWVFEGHEFVWKPTKSTLSINKMFDIKELNFCGKDVAEVDLRQFDLILTVIETHHNNKKLRTTTRPIIWRSYYSILKGEGNFNGPVVYASKFIKDISRTPGVAIYETRNPDIYNKWSGNQISALSVTANASDKIRYAACGGQTIDQIAESVEVCRVVGSQTQKDLLEMYKQCRVYIDAAPDVRKLTYARVFSGSFIEAMMCGMPTVVTNTNEFGLIINNGINGFKCNTTSEMISKIQKLFDDKKLADRIGNAARNKALQIYSPTSIKKQWEEVFKRAGV